MVVIQLLLLLTLISGVHPLGPEEIHVKAGEIVALFCEGLHGSDSKTLWKSDSNLDMHLFNNMPAAEQRQMGVVAHRNSLLILSASVNHQGNYTCSVRNSSSRSWFRLTVHTQSRQHEEKVYPSKPCYTQESCQLDCPTKNIPAEDFSSGSSITWPEAPEDGFFSRVKMENSGVYNCIRSYLYHGQMYNVTFQVNLEVQSHHIRRTAGITKPRQTDVFDVELGSPKVIECEAVMYSCSDSLFWLWSLSSLTKFVETNTSSRIFYNTTCKHDGKELKMTASLVFTQVLEKDLLKSYTCKLEPVHHDSSFVTIMLTQKARPSHVPLAVCIVVFIVVSVVAVFIYVKFKVDISLFLRDTLGCHSSTSDGKIYDAFLMCYESDTDGGLNAHDRKMLESVLEERFGYSLCLYDRDVLPGRAVAQAVIECIEQSSTVVLVPTSPDPGLGLSLLSTIHEALVERQTRLVFINTETPEVSRSGSLPEALQLLSEAGNHVTWKGISSMPPSSSFWKQLRYYLPAPQCAPKMEPLLQTVQHVTSK